LSEAERKTIYNVLGLYFISTILIITSISYGYYVTEKEKRADALAAELSQKSKLVFEELKEQHNRLENKIIYPRYQEFESAIYDIDKNLIFSTFEPLEIDPKKSIYFRDGYDYYIFKTPQYYLGAAFIVIKQQGESLSKAVFLSMIPTLLSVFAITILTSFFLVKLVLKPIRDSLSLLDRFVKDTTHELNTPISTILTNIELIESQPISCENFHKKISRIKSASITISNLYEDLVYLTLHHRLQYKNQTISLNGVIKNRTEYFATLFASKSITVSIEQLGEALLFIDPKKIERVIDNLLSNAIKYSPKNSKIDIVIDKNSFKICDKGRGMSQEEVDKISERYSRFSTEQSGFGIGFNIIHNIAKEYKLDISIKSAPKEGTCVTISW